MEFTVSLLPLLLLIIFSSFSLSSQLAVTVKVKSATSIAKTDDNFVCATLDWWPKEKCNYDMCPWGNASILNLNLTSPILYNAVKAFGSLRIRLGGSMQDRVLYVVGSNPPKCGPSFEKRKGGMFGFSEGCLSMERWGHLNEFLQSTGAIITFGLNALNGRKNDHSHWTGNWDSSNTRDFIEFTLSKGYNIDSYEFGNELSGGGVGARVDAKQYGTDLIALKNLIHSLYRNSTSKPMILAPGGFFDANWFGEMLHTSGPGVVGGLTHHVYNLGPGSDPNLVGKILDGNYLDGAANTYKNIERTIRDHGPWTSAWVGESGGAYNSGGRVASHTFVDSFWYLDQLGMTSSFDHKVFCRQTLVGGNYGLLDTTTFVPNPDYYSALLWHRLMGPRVLRTTHNGPPTLRAYTHCSKHKGGVTMLLINLSKWRSYSVSVYKDVHVDVNKLYPPEVQYPREEYHLTPNGSDILSSVMLLNGRPLSLNSAGEIPEMYPIGVKNTSAPIVVAPLSIAFIRFVVFGAPACRH